MARNHRIRFAANNFAETPNVAPTVSSELAGFPISNAQNPSRSKVWKPAGSFTIADTNNKLYINDGSSNEITLDSATYGSAAALATEIETKVNAAIGPITLSVSYTASFFFEFTFSTSVTLEISNQTNAAWDTLGFIHPADLTGTVLTADDLRIHSSEYVTFDFGFPAEISFFSMIPPADTTLGLTDSAVVRVQANNIDDFVTNVPYESIGTVTPNGVFTFLDTSEDLDDLPSFRFWRVEIIDRTNALGNSFLNIGNIYLGTYTSISARNIQSGFEKNLQDPTIITQSDSGVQFFDERTKYREYSGVNLLYLTSEDRLELEDFINRQGVSRPFYVALDPTLINSQSTDELVLYSVFNRMPRVVHVSNETYSMAMNFREAL
jgi:hypothetical protein